MTESIQGCFFDSNGVPIRYVVKGSGQPVVLLHGFTRSIETAWVERDFFANPFDGYQLIAMDCRGHGKSGKPHSPLAYGKHMVDDVIRLLDHLQIERAHLLGHSMGAEIVLKTVVQHPTRVRSAILAGSGWSDDSIYALFKPLAESLERGHGLAPLVEWITPVDQSTPTASQVQELNDRLLSGNDVLALAALCRSHDEREELRVTEQELRGIRVPVLGITGELDVERPMLERMQGVVPNFTLIALPGLGHTGPEVFQALAKEARRFFNSISVRPELMGADSDLDQRIAHAKQQETRMEHVTSRDGTVIGFACRGSGAPLLLVHGTTADHRRWSQISPRFEQHFAVYAMDRRGRGASGDAPAYNILREAEDVAAVVEAIGEPTCLLGHSYGAICSLEAARLTDKVRRLVLYEPPIPTGLPLYPPGVPERIQALVDQGDLEAALEVFLREIVRMPEHELATYRRLPMWHGRILLAPTIPRELAFDRTYRFHAEKFAGLQTPTMLLLGSDSPPIFQQASAVVDAALPDSRVIVLPGQQHIAMDTNPELFVSEVLHFLASLRPDPVSSV